MAQAGIQKICNKKKFTNKHQSMVRSSTCNIDIHTVNSLMLVGIKAWNFEAKLYSWLAQDSGSIFTKTLSPGHCLTT